MTLEIDHLFVYTDTADDSASKLRELGLLEGTGATHPGQGTANRRFFFHNFMLELLWVENPDEAQSEVVRRTGLWERWRDRNSGACPFGLALRGGKMECLPFSHWNYRPPYLPDRSAIPVATNSLQTEEPLLFWIPFGGRPDSLNGKSLQPLYHPCSLKELTGITCAIPKEKLSAELQAIAERGLATFINSTEYWVELEFDGNQFGVREDLRPRLPLLMRW